jgi:hypothetical protein
VRPPHCLVGSKNQAATRPVPQAVVVPFKKYRVSSFVNRSRRYKSYLRVTDLTKYSIIARYCVLSNHTSHMMLGLFGLSKLDPRLHLALFYSSTSRCLYALPITTALAQEDHSASFTRHSFLRTPPGTFTATEVRDNFVLHLPTVHHRTTLCVCPSWTFPLSKYLRVPLRPLKYARLHRPPRPAVKRTQLHQSCIQVPPGTFHAT